MSDSINLARAAVRRAIAEVEKTFRVGESDVWEEIRLLRKVEASLTEPFRARMQVLAAKGRAA